MKEAQEGGYQARWETSEGRELAAEAWRRLVRNESIRSLPLAEHAGRTDLRGISAPEITKQELPPWRNWSLQKLKGQLEFRNVNLEDLDFSGATLKHLRLVNSRVINCRFDDADCEDWGVRASDVVRTTFIGASLLNAVLGVWFEGRGNKYELVDFSHAEMRGLVSTSATYLDCNFSHAKLDKIDFQSSSFVRCRFAGEVREVLFYDLGFQS